MEEIQEIQEVDCPPSSSTDAREGLWSGDENGDGWIGRAKDLEAPVKVAVAVGKSSSSLQALQWALANLNEVLHGHGDHLIHLLHVQSPIRFVPTPMGNNIPIGQASPDMVNKCKLQRFVETERLLSQHRRMCEEKEVRCEVICTEGEAVEKALIDEICRRCIPMLVLGDSSRSRLKKAFKGQSIATIVTRSRPEFCTVIVINKGQVQSRKEARTSPAAPLLLDG